MFRSCEYYKMCFEHLLVIVDFVAWEGSAPGIEDPTAVPL
jgi:hypothetical protein